MIGMRNRNIDRKNINPKTRNYYYHWWGYLIELAVAKESSDNFDDVVGDVALEQPIGVVSLYSNTRRHQAHVLNEVFEYGPDERLRKNLLGLVLRINVAMVPCYF